MEERRSPGKALGDSGPRLLWSSPPPSLHVKEGKASPACGLRTGSALASDPFNWGARPDGSVRSVAPQSELFLKLAPWPSMGLLQGK